MKPLTAVIRRLLCIEWMGVEQKLAQIYSVNRMQIKLLENTCLFSLQAL